MITVTSLKHPTMKRKIMQASKNVLIKRWSVDHVRNNKGQAILAIRYDDVTKKFIVFDKDYKVMTDTVARAL